MKITKIVPLEQFKPFSVVISVETAEELRALKEMATRNLSIPDFFGGRHTPKWEIVKAFLDQLKDTLDGAT